MNQVLFTQSDIESFHWIKFNSQNGRVVYILTGILKVEMKGSSQNWAGLNITCKIKIPELPAGIGLYIRHHAPSASLNSIYNDRVANNSGHSVNTCDLSSVRPNGNFGADEITLALGLAVRDVDAYIHRIGFNISMTGDLRPLPWVDPCKIEKDTLTSLENLCNGGYQQRISMLQDLLNDPGTSPQMRALIQAQIREVTSNLNNCPVDLSAAKLALQRCILQNPVIPNLDLEETNRQE